MAAGDVVSGVEGKISFDATEYEVTLFTIISV